MQHSLRSPVTVTGHPFAYHFYRPQTEEDDMTCRFKGEFTEGVQERIERAAQRYERIHSGKDSADTAEPKWAFVHFKTPYQGSSYWGVRIENGYMVKAQTARGLAAAVDAAREERIRRRSQAVRQASRAASHTTRSREADGIRMRGNAAST